MLGAVDRWRKPWTRLALCHRGLSDGSVTEVASYGLLARTKGRSWTCEPSCGWDVASQVSHHDRRSTASRVTRCCSSSDRHGPTDCDLALWTRLGLGVLAVGVARRRRPVSRTVTLLRRLGYRAGAASSWWSRRRGFRPGRRLPTRQPRS